MQSIFNTISMINIIILVFIMCLALTSNQERVSRETVSSKGKNPVKAASQFEVTPIAKAKRQTKGKVQKTDRSKLKKVSG